MKSVSIKTECISNHNPIDTECKLNTQDVQKTSRTSSEHVMYVQFTSCVYGE